MSDLVRALQEDHGLAYRFIMTGGIGPGIIPKAMAYLYKPDRLQPETVNDTGLLSVIVDVDAGYATDPKPLRDLVQTQCC